MLSLVSSGAIVILCGESAVAGDRVAHRRIERQRLGRRGADRVVSRIEGRECVGAGRVRDRARHLPGGGVSVPRGRH